MLPIDLREPINAMSHGAGMLMSLPVTWLLWYHCKRRNPCAVTQACRTTSRCTPRARRCEAARHHQLKMISLLVFGTTLTFCYAASALFHGLPYQGAALSPYQKLDHIGIYLLIAGTYTPIVWSMLRGRWLWGTLLIVWAVALMSAFRIWHDGVFPVWIATPIYLTMGWGSVFCYRELARTYSHRTLLSLPMGGVFYSVGAAINLAKWPILLPGVLGSHELFHLFVIAGSASHVLFMTQVVIPAPWPGLAPTSVRTRPMSALLLRWGRAMLSRRIRQWMLSLPHPQWLESVLVVEPIPSDAPRKLA